MSHKKVTKKNQNTNPFLSSLKKILLASAGPIKTIVLMWGFLILIIVFIYFNLFEDYGLFSFLENKYMVFNTIMVTFSGILFLYWLIVWNDLIKAFFKKDLQNNKSNNIKQGEMNG